LDDQGIKAAHVSIGLFKAKDTPESIQSVTLHELGHACGLDGHSPRPADVLYMSAGTAEVPTRLTARDKETIRKFYTEDIGESWLALNNRGITLAQKHEFQAALQCYLKAQQLTDNPMVNSNLAALHFSWAGAAANEGDQKIADEHFAAALQIQKKQPDANYGVMIDAYAKYLRSHRREGEATAVEALRRK
jgi:tetratricopeptide (TPR) repeat protein